MILDARQYNVYARGLGTCQAVLPRLEWYEKMAQVYPGIRENAAQLRTFWEWSRELAQRALDEHAAAEREAGTDAR